VILVHPQNSLKGLVLNQCIGGCWLIPACLSVVVVVVVVRF
jgi:hypothetical protein